MTKQQLINRDKFISAILHTAEHNGKEMTYFEAINFADWLHRCETTLNRLAIDECESENYDFKKQERTEQRVEYAIKERIGCKCYTQRDPRGFCIRLYLVNSDGYAFTNSWDGETSGCNW